MMAMAIDGAQGTGRYRVDCECGQNWSGQCERFGAASYTPALPIAECVVHLRMCHEGGTPNLRFSLRFEQWLTHYWELMSLRAATGIEVS